MTPDLPLFTQALGAELRLARRIAGHSQRQAVAEIHRRTGVKTSGPMLSRWELGTHQLGIDRLITLCRIYDVDPLHIIDTALRHATPARSHKGTPRRKGTFPD